MQAIADGEVAQGIVGYDPVANSQVTADEIRRAEADPAVRLRLAPTALPVPKRLRGSRYTPVAKRNDRPDAIAFLLRNYPQLSETQVSKLLGTTKDTIQKVRERTHWNSANIKPRDPVILGLCSQTDLNAAVAQANERLEREGRAVPPRPCRRRTRSSRTWKARSVHSVWLRRRSISSLTCSFSIFRRVRVSLSGRGRWSSSAMRNSSAAWRSFRASRWACRVINLLRSKSARIVMVTRLTHEGP